MRSFHRYTPAMLHWLSVTVLIVQLALMVPSAHAHLMVAQHGTLNVIDDDVFMVLSLPISAFEIIDDDRNGQVSMLEFNHHRTAIVESLTQNLTLSDQQGAVPLHGIMLSPVTPHDSVGGAISQLTVMGRFVLSDPLSGLSFNMGLYGTQAGEQSLHMTATRSSDNRKTVFELTPDASVAVLFPDSE